MKQLEEFIAKLSSEGFLWLRSEILKQPELRREEEKIIRVLIPIVQENIAEIRDRLRDEDFSKEDLSEMYFHEIDIKELITSKLTKKLNHKLTSTEFDLISKILKHYETLLVEVWLNY